jgi:hypothetical protein
LNDLWVVGGQQRLSFRRRAEWRRYGCAVVARVRDGAPERAFEYRVPEAHRAGEGSHCFKAATFTRDRAYLCTDTEVLVCALPRFTIERVISLPCFNDLHHVTPGPQGSLFVVSTGLDAVVEVTPEGELLRAVDVLGGSVWDRFSPTEDYRRVASTKPHRSHPTFVFFRDGEPWVTRFEQRDAVPLFDSGRPSRPLASAGLHDGQLHGERVLFTTVDGCVVAAEGEETLRATLAVPLRGHEERGAAGWCRGLLVEGERAWVGFSLLRFTELRHNLSWMASRLRGAEPNVLLPTRVALHDLRSGELLAETRTDTVGLDAVFSIHPVGDVASETG